MTDRTAESGVASWDALDDTTSPMMEIVTHDATRDDVGAMANIFIGSFKGDKTAQLLYPPDSIWPVVVEMIGEYLDDDYTRVITAWDNDTERMVGWTSISQVVSRREDRFEFCDSTIWAGRQLLLREARARASEGPLSVDETRRACLVGDLSRRNRDGQNRNIDGQHLAINTVAIDPDVIECEIPQVAYQLIRYARDLAKREVEDKSKTQLSTVLMVY